MVSAKDNKEDAGVHTGNVKWDPEVSRSLFNVNDGLTGRDGGPYLDEVEQREGEKRRAAVENRQPDLKNPGPVAGTVLVTGVQLMSQQNVPNIPSQEDKDVVGSVIAEAANSDKFLSNKVETLPDQKEVDKVLDEVRQKEAEAHEDGKTLVAPIPAFDVDTPTVDDED